jgi:hypothetical protein
MPDLGQGLPATCPLVPCNGRPVAPAQALPDVRQAGDMSKIVPPGFAAAKYLGFWNETYKLFDFTSNA